MRGANSIIHYSLFAALCGAFAMPAGAAVHVHNASRSYANAYNQVNAIRAQEEYAAQQYNDTAASTGGAMVVETESAAVTLPVTVADSALAQKIAMGDPSAPVSMDQLQSCAMIYPNGEFAWDVPTAGMKKGGDATCVAMVEMRGYQMDGKGGDLVLARAYIAAGDAIKCNISDFPESSYTEAAGRITFPVDSEPTVDDVVKVMNEEQKQNAGFKIAAGAIIGAVGGNIAGKNAPGQDGMFGTGKDKIQSSLVGALSGSAIAAGSAYTGKVAGDIILSTGVNAAAGAAIGNMVASAGSGSTLRIERCTVNNVETSCLYGVYAESTDFNFTDDKGDAVKSAFYKLESKSAVACDVKKGENVNCNPVQGMNIVLEGGTAVDNLSDAQIQKLKNDGGATHFYMDDKNKTISSDAYYRDNGTYLKIQSLGIQKGGLPAMIADFDEKAFGSSSDDWAKWRAANPKAQIWGRNGNGSAYDLEIKDMKLENFIPSKRDASSGGLVDISNKSRIKGTMTGAGLGGAMGAFSAYQGAQKDIDDRWVAAVREYKDSLSKIYCGTGSRFLSQYNDVASIGLPAE